MTAINTKVGTREFADFMVPGHKFLTDHLTLAFGQNIVKRQVLARKADGELVTYDSEAAAPENVAYCIAVHDADATSAATRIAVYLMGVFKKSRVVFGDTGSYEDDAFDDLRERGIFLHGTST